MNARTLIVNADDFGQSPGVTSGIIAAHEQGIVTSASLMVRWPAAVAAAAYAREYPSLSVGLHLDLGEWVYRDDEWTPLYEVAPTDDIAAVADEIARQVDAFRSLLGRDPTHIDSHQHVHRGEPVRSLLRVLAATLRIPLRGETPGVQYRGDFYGQSGTGYPYPQAITVEALINVIQTLPPGVTELGCHPGDREDVDSVYRSERLSELATLRDPRVREAINANSVSLRRFSNADLTFSTGLEQQALKQERA
jgi:predicted glycoside hydrolase/deacetylase ChbG (UPF0249 family)